MAPASLTVFWCLKNVAHPNDILFIDTSAHYEFKSKQITLTPFDGVIKRETLCSHLTTEIVDKKQEKERVMFNFTEGYIG